MKSFLEFRKLFLVFFSSYSFIMQLFNPSLEFRLILNDCFLVKKLETSI